MTYSKDREIDAKVRALVHEGWTADRGRKHWKVRHPVTGYTLIVPGTPSDPRAVLNWFAQFHRAERTGFANTRRGS